MWIAEHRSALTSFEKVNALLNSEFSIPIKYAWTAVDIYTKIYYKCKNLTKTCELEPEKNPIKPTFEKKKKKERF